MDWSDLNARQRDILTSLAKHEPRNGRELAHQLDIDPSTANRNLATLRDEGLVVGDESVSGRGDPIANRLTDDGEALVRENIVEPAQEIQE